MCENRKACFLKPFKFIAGISRNCVQTLSNSVTNDGSIKHPFASLTYGVESILSYLSA